MLRSLYSLVASLLLLVPAARAEESPAVAPLIVAPSSTSLAGGKVKLSTSTLNRKANTFIGDYRIRVTPYFFKNEEGAILIVVPDNSLRKLTKGVSLEFDGKATTNGTGQTRPIRVKATGAGDGYGALTICIKTENGDMVFNSAYRFGNG